MLSRQRRITYLIAAGLVGTWMRERGTVFGVLGLVGIHGAMLLGAWTLARRMTREGNGLAITLVRTGQVYFVSTIAIGLALGLFGLLGPWAFATCGGITAWLMARGPGPPLAPLTTDRNARLWYGITLLLIVIVGIKSLADPEYVYDALTYHLYYPATWVQEGRITRITTWCGGVVTDYAPCSTETYYATLMLPVGMDIAARSGQFPFWLLLLAGVSALGQALGLSARARAIVTTAITLLPGPALQGTTAMLDVALAAHLICVVAFAVRASRSRAATDVAGGILSAGLLLGSKFLAITSLMAIAPLLLYAAYRWLTGPHRRRSLRGIGAAMAIALCIGPVWHVWNTIETGNPIYPVAVKVAGRTLFTGAFGTRQIANSIHNMKLRFGSEGFARVYWQALHVFAIPDDVELSRLDPRVGALGGIVALAILGAAVLIRRMPMVGLLYFAGALLLISFSWWVAPIQHARFVWGPLILLIVGTGGLLDASFPLRMTASAVGAVIWVTSVIPIFAQTITTGCLNVLQFDDVRQRTFHEPGKRAMGEAWAYIDNEVHGSTIAWIGNNIPYFLMGRRFENRLVYVPSRRPALRRFHEYAALADVVRLGRPNTSEPTPDRYTMNPQAWLGNLREMHVQYVVVNTLKSLPMLTLNIRHDAEGFPIERKWLDELALRGLATRIELGQSATRIYKLSIREDTSLSDLPEIAQDEVDALDEMSRAGLALGDVIPHYPCAGPFIKMMRLKPLSAETR